VAVISNWVRVLVIMYAGYASGMQSVVATRGHVLFGWLLFALVLAGFAWLATRSVARTVGIRPYPTRSGSAVGARAAYVTVVGVLIAMPILARALPAALDDGAASLQLTMPAGRSGWRGPVSISKEQWKPTFVGAHSEWRAAYEDSTGDIVEMLAIGYSKQEQDRELVNYCNSLLGEGPCTSSPGGSEHDLRALTASSIDRGTHAHVEVLAVDAMGRRFVVWWVYDIGGRMFVTPIYSQLWYGLRSLGGVPPSVLLAYRTACAPSCEAARGRLSRFLESMGGNFVTSQTRPVTRTTGGGSPG
jgi:EpsI family protein